MSLDKQWLALGILDAFGNINSERQAKFQRITKDTYELGDKCRLENCFETLCLLINDAVDYQGRCLVPHIEVKKLLFYPSLRRDPSAAIFSELAGIVLSPESQTPIGKTLSRSEYQRLEKFCEIIDPNYAPKRDIFWLIQLCAYAEGHNKTIIDREDWQYLALCFDKPGRKSKRYTTLQKKYETIAQATLEVSEPDNIHPLCHEYANCWHEAHEFIFNHGVSYSAGADPKHREQLDALTSKLEALLEKLYQSRKKQGFGLPRSAALTIYLHWMIAWFYFAKSNFLGQNPDQNSAAQNELLKSLEQCRSHLMLAYTQEAHFSQTHTYDTRKKQALVYGQLILADINRLIASLAAQVQFPMSQVSKSDSYGEYVKFSREAIQETDKMGGAQNELWLKQATFELTTNTALRFPDEAQARAKMKVYFEQTPKCLTRQNRYSTKNTANRFVSALFEARQFFLESQQTDQKCRDQGSMGQFFLMPEVEFDEGSVFADLISEYDILSGEDRYFSYLSAGEKLLTQSQLIKSEGLEMSSHILSAFYHLSSAHNEVSQAWFAHQSLKAALDKLRLLESSLRPLGDLKRKLIYLQAKAALQVSRQAQKLYTDFEGRKVLSREDKCGISHLWLKKANELSKELEKCPKQVSLDAAYKPILNFVDQHFAEHVKDDPN